MLDECPDRYIKISGVAEIMPIIEISVDGLKKISTAFIRFTPMVIKNMASAGEEALNMVLDTEGLRTYPPLTSANLPPTPYYIRGRGTQMKYGNLGNSENYKQKWQLESSTYEAKAKNVGVSYNEYLGGEDQVWWASTYGWKKLYSTAVSMISDIVKIYEAWIEKTIKELGL